MSQDFSPSSASSVTEWLHGLKAGRVDASGKIWLRYVEQLIRVAEQRLKHLPRRMIEGDDIAQEAFAGFFRGVRENSFVKLDDRCDLWQLLITLADRRATDALRRELAERRGEGRVRGDSVVSQDGDTSGAGRAGFDNIAGPPVTPDCADALIRVIQRSFPELADTELQEIALDRISGYSTEEIAKRRGVALRTVERKLAIIRQVLEQAMRDND